MTYIKVPYLDQRIKEVVPTMWQDFYLQGRPFSRHVIDSDHFTSWVADKYTITEVNNSTQTILDERNGVLRLTPAGAENDGTHLTVGGTGDGETTGESWAPASGKNLWFECRVRSNTDIDQNDVFVGLHVQSTTFVASRGSDYIGFSINDGSALINAECAASSVASTETGLVTGADATWYTLGFKVTSLDKVDFYVDDVLKATIRTNIPTALMKVCLGHLSGEASANVFDIDYWIVAQDI